MPVILGNTLKNSLGGLGDDDTIGGGAGNDTMDGSKRDIIKDCTPGEDKLDLSGIDIAPVTSGHQGLHRSNDVQALGVWQAFEKASGGIIDVPSGMRIMIDTDGDAAADMIVTVQFGEGMAVGKIATTDFIF